MLEKIYSTGFTYDHHYDRHNNFIVQATGFLSCKEVPLKAMITFVIVRPFTNNILIKGFQTLCEQKPGLSH